MTEASFAGRFERLVSGDRPGSESAAILSDLSGADRAHVGSIWKSIPDETRRTIVTEAGLLADENVSFDFEQLMLIALGDEDPTIRRLAAESLEEATSRETARSIGRILTGDDDPSVRAAAAGALGNAVVSWDGLRGFSKAHAEVLDLLRGASTRDPSEEVRGRALVAAAGAPRPWLGALLEDAYYGESRDLRLLAVRAMGMTCDEAWLEYLIEQLASFDSEFRVEAAAACGELGAEDAIGPLAALAGDEDAEVMIAAIAAIARIGGSLALEVLTDLRTDPPPTTDIEILEAAIAEVKESETAFGFVEDEE
ncbi:MAG: HEAT repeat domain-containing protein [Dehalococcoidia bacterium]